MSTADIREAVRRARGRAKIEISGGVTLERIPELAATGADFVSVGALTHSAPAVDISFEIEPHLRSASARFRRRRWRPRVGAPRRAVSARSFFFDRRIDQRRRGGARGVGTCEGAVVIADEQTAGRGRRGRDVVFAAGQRALRVGRADAGARDRDRDRAATLVTLAAGVALAEAVEAATGLRVDLKWPNDLYVARRKLAGILAEGRRRPSGAPVVVFGYGINVGADGVSAGAGRSRDVARNRARTSGRSRARCSSRRSRRWRGATTTCSTAGSMLFSTRGARARRAARGARVSWTTPAGRALGRDGRHRRPRARCSSASAIASSASSPAR